ncbi:MAG: beta-propeller fold lactonase family protein [Candidatus Hydrogenedentes bacterium]|nr:beta-propeller fold lactonase family protein [Candidatus Hydrogenedentota bacterium]
MFVRAGRFVCLAVIGTLCCWAQSPFVNFETPQIHPVDISPDKTTLAVCNTAAAQLELFNISSGNPLPMASVAVGYDPVTVRFRNNNEAWVVNHISDSVSIVDIPTRRVRATIATADEPCDVVFAGNPVFAFVSCSQADRVQRFNPNDLGALPTDIEIGGEDPRALAVSPDGLTVYAAIFESGNRSTIISGGSDGTLDPFPGNEAMEDPDGPYDGVNPPPNDPNDSDTNGNLFVPAKAANGTAPKVGLIVKEDANGAWRDDNNSDWTRWITGDKANLSGRYTGWQLLDRDVAVINTGTLTVTYIEHLMNLNMAIAVNPASGDITVVGTEATNEIRFEPVITGRFIRVRLAMVDVAKSATIYDLNAEHLAIAQGGNPYEEERVPQIERNKSIGDPRGIVWNAAGTLGFITGMGSNNLVVINSAGERIDVGFAKNLREGPTGLALDEGRNRLYVLNRFHGSISVVDLTTFNEIANVPMFDPTPAAIKTGRKHLYDTHKNSGLGQIACGSCHIDGRMDRLAWDLGDPAGAIKPLSGAGNPPIHNLGAGIPGLLAGGTSPAFENFHPMKGPMTTQTLQGIIGMEPHHWRGDRNGLEEFNPAFVGLQGDDVVAGTGGGGLTQGEMQEFENFVATMHFPPNPHRNFDNTLPTNLPLPRQFANGRFTLANGAPLPNGDAVHGLQLYRSQDAPLDSGNFSCVICHTLPTGAGTDSFLSFPGGLPTFVPIPPGPMGERHLALVSVDGATNRAIKVPHLRNQFDKVGFELTPGNPSYSGFGVFHDGSIDSIARFVSEPVFEVQSDQDVADLTALVLSFSGGFAPGGNPGPFPEAPGPPSADAHAAVGKQITVASASKVDPLVDQMLAQANLLRVDVIVKADILSYQRGWKYLGANQFRPDSEDEDDISKTQLLALAAPGSELTFTVVPFGSGNRLGIDRDLDENLDFDEFLASDATPPAAKLESDAPDVVDGAIDVDVTLSEPSKNFIATDIAVTNATVSNFQGSGLNYTFTLTPTANGTFTAKVNGGKFSDFAGNGNVVSNTLSRSNGEPAGKIKVKQPNGGEDVEAGAKYKVKWTTQGAVGNKVKIELWRNGAFVSNVKASTDNDGKQTWNVDQGLPKGSGYTVRVVSKVDAGIADASNGPFDIVAP